MSQPKRASKRKSRACAVPLLGAAGLSLSLATGASAATEVPADIPTQNTWVNPEITLAEEEISDVSLATFYVFDKENPGTSGPGLLLAGKPRRRRRRLQRLRRRQRLQRLRRRPRPRLQRLRRRPPRSRLQRLRRRLRRLRRRLRGDLVGGLRRLRRVFRRLLVLAERRSDLVLLLT